jgi:predicted amidohydrolase YtcJ
MAARLTAYIVASIVAVTLIAGLIVGAQRDDDGPVDLIIFNGKVYAADGGEGFAEAIAVRGNQILRVGSNREIKRLRRAQTVVLDAHGGAVLPGFNDSHTHFIGGGLALDRVNLLDAVTLEQIQEKVRAYAAANPDEPWILGRGWYYAPFPGGLPVRQQLDELVPDRPAYLTCYDGHTGWANTKALQLAGITRRTPSPKGGVIVKDPRTGEPTGVLKESAQRLMSKVLPEVSRADRIDALRHAMTEAHRLGVTSVQNAGGGAEEIELYDEVRRAGDLKVRVYAAASVRPGFTEADADRLDELRKRYPEDPLLKTGAVKLVADGTIEAHTAAMLEPYAGKTTTGISNYTAEELTRVVAMLDKRGWQILIHAIGDRAIRMALDAFEAAAAANPAPARGRRHRIEHVESTDAADIGRFGRLGVIASMQPFHGNPSANQIDVWAGNIGPDRASRAWVYRSILDRGGRVAFGSDWPVVSLDPRFGVAMAVNRTTPDGRPDGGWIPEQRLALAAALDAYSRAAAYASFDEHRKGSLARGMLADIVILSADIFSMPRERLLDAVVDTTIFDGKVVYSREPAAATAQ